MIDNSSNLVSFFHQFTFKSGFILIPKGGNYWQWQLQGEKIKLMEFLLPLIHEPFENKSIERKVRDSFLKTRVQLPSALQSPPTFSIQKSLTAKVSRSLKQKSRKFGQIQIQNGEICSRLITKSLLLKKFVKPNQIIIFNNNDVVTNLDHLFARFYVFYVWICPNFQR